MEENPDLKLTKKDKLDLYKIAIWVSVGMIIWMLVMVIWEVKQAKEFCESHEGKFEFKKTFTHNYYCNDKPIYKYNDNTFDYDRELKNFTIK